MAIFGWTFNTVFGMLVHKGFLKTVPRKLDEAAAFDVSGITAGAVKQYVLRR